MFGFEQRMLLYKVRVMEKCRRNFCKNSPRQQCCKKKNIQNIGQFLKYRFSAAQKKKERKPKCMGGGGCMVT
jgi:hypothetical protein